ncbi:MAG: ABC transporter substrate-binding protein, partial [Rhizobiaceae bacterium]
MRKPKYALGGAGLLLSVSILAAQAQTVQPTTPPDPPTFDAQGTPTFVGIKDIFEYKALPEYHEPEWVKTKYVDAGTLPA